MRIHKIFSLFILSVLTAITITACENVLSTDEKETVTVSFDYTTPLTKSCSDSEVNEAILNSLPTALSLTVSSKSETYHCKTGEKIKLFPDEYRITAEWTGIDCEAPSIMIDEIIEIKNDRTEYTLTAKYLSSAIVFDKDFNFFQIPSDNGYKTVEKFLKGSSFNIVFLPSTNTTIRLKVGYSQDGPVEEIAFKELLPGKFYFPTTTLQDYGFNVNYPDWTRNEDIIRIQVFIDTPTTKSTGQEKETEFRNLQVFVFKDDKIDGYAFEENTSKIEVPCTAGQREIFCVANAPRLMYISSLNELRNTLTNLTDNSPESFVKIGNVSANIKDKSEVLIAVKRIASRISFSKMSVAFPNTPEYSGKNLRLTGIYVINVSKTIYFSLQDNPLAWYNKLGHEDEDADSFLYDALNYNIINGQSYETKHTFYVYPNYVETSIKDIDESCRGTWTPRRTVLVIQVEFNGKTGFYPIELPIIECNKSYTIEEIKVTRAPGNKPYEPIEAGQATVSITVNNWDNQRI